MKEKSRAKSLISEYFIFVIFIALVVVLVFGVSKAGGVGAVVENAQSMSGYLSMTATYDPESGKSATYNLLKIFSTAAWGLGYFGMPHILLRFMAIEDDRKLKTSRRIATIWVVPADSGIAHDHNGGNDHCHVIVHTEQRTKQLAAGGKAGGCVRHKEYNN